MSAAFAWFVVERGVALSMLVHFLSWECQIVGLVGANGLEPAKDALKQYVHFVSRCLRVASSG